MNNYFSHIGDTTVEFLVSPPAKKFRWGNLVFLCLLFTAGLFQWCRSLNWGRGPLNFHDWADITGPRLTFLQNAMVEGVLPLHTANTEALGGITTRFMAIPDVILSPQIIFLRYLDLSAFIIFQFGLMYTLGFLGLLQLRKKFGLSIFAFMVIFFLYNFNGHILAHFSVGHFTWGGSFLFSWFALFVLELIEGKTGWDWVTKIAILLFVILLQGSYHQFVWCVLFLLFLVIFSIKNIGAVVKGVAFSLLISAVRLLPPFILLGKFANQFIGGYRDSLSIIECMIHLQTPSNQTTFEGFSGGMTTWESTIYIGIVGAAFLMYFGFYRSVTNFKEAHGYKVLILPTLILIFMSMERVFQTLRELFPIPLLTGERVSARMIGLAFVMVLVLATIEFQNWLNQRKTSKFTVALLILILLLEGNDLWQNYTLWSVSNAAGTFPEQGFTPSMWYVANDLTDAPYLRLIMVGLVITIISLGFLIAKVWRENHHRSSQGQTA